MLRSLPFHCLNFSVSVTVGSSENHSSFESGGRMYGKSGSSEMIRTLAPGSRARIDLAAANEAVPPPINRKGACDGTSGRSLTGRISLASSLSLVSFSDACLVSDFCTTCSSETAFTSPSPDASSLFVANSPFLYARCKICSSLVLYLSLSSFSILYTYTPAPKLDKPRSTK